MSGLDHDGVEMEHGVVIDNMTPLARYLPSASSSLACSVEFVGLAIAASGGARATPSCSCCCSTAMLAADAGCCFAVGVC